MRSGGEVHVGHGMLEVGTAFGVELAMRLDESGAHGAVDVNAGAFGKAFGLKGTCLFDASAHGSGRFAEFG